MEKVKWPTPATRDYKDTGTVYTPIRKDGKNRMDTLGRVAANGGQLNPTWVGWLMGWPLNWESLDPLTSLTWLSWEVDPADGEVVGRKWDTPSVGDSHPRALGIKKPYNGPGQEHLQSQALRQDSTGPIPRVATGVKDRVNRLKCLGNGIVPQCMYLAWRILTDEN